MTPNIYIIGAQCTGKTTLFNALVRHFDNLKYQVDFDKEREEQKGRTEGVYDWGLWDHYDERDHPVTFLRPPYIIHEVARRVIRLMLDDADRAYRNRDICLRIHRMIINEQLLFERKALSIGGIPGYDVFQEQERREAEGRTMDDTEDEEEEEEEEDKDKDDDERSHSSFTTEYSCNSVDDDPLGPGARWFVSDRSGLDPVVYTRRGADNDAAYELLRRDEWRIEMKDRMQRALVVLCEPVHAKWLKQDGLRQVPADLEELWDIHRAFCRELKEQEIPYIALPSSVEDLTQRVALVLGEWERRYDDEVEKWPAVAKEMAGNLRIYEPLPDAAAVALRRHRREMEEKKQQQQRALDMEGWGDQIFKPPPYKLDTSEGRASNNMLGWRIWKYFKEMPPIGVDVEADKRQISASTLP